MLPADVRFRFRPPVSMLLWRLAYQVLATTIFLATVRSDTVVKIGLGLLAVIVPLSYWRVLRLSAVGTADGRLVVRNYWKDRTLHRDDIDDVVVGSSFGGSWLVRLRLADGTTVRLDATEVPFRSSAGVARLEEHAARIRDWAGVRPRTFF